MLAVTYVIQFNSKEAKDLTLMYSQESTILEIPKSIKKHSRRLYTDILEQQNNIQGR
jgi:hypothetical protein